MVDANNILTLGVCCKEPKGGIAYVLNVYSKTYRPFNFVATTKCKGSIRNFITFIYAYLKTMYFLIFKRIQIVHIHTASYSSFWRKSYFINLSISFKKKIVLHVHGGQFDFFYRLHPKRIKKILLKVDEIVVLSESWKAFFKNEVGLENVTIIYNIVEEPEPHALISDLKKCHFLFLGYIDNNKGVFDLVETIIERRDIFEDKFILHIGGNGEVKRLQKIISENKLEELIHYEGWISGDKKLRLLSTTDVYILPSYNEGLPISILEAMSYKLPIITTPVGGIPEIVENEVNGLIVKAGNREELGNAILRLMCDVSERKRMGLESFKKVGKYLPSNIEHQLDALYEDVLEN